MSLMLERMSKSRVNLRPCRDSSQSGGPKNLNVGAENELLSTWNCFGGVHGTLRRRSGRAMRNLYRLNEL